MTTELRFERLINAAREVVFEMFTDPGGQAAALRSSLLRLT
jgi:uncharacterized protein YndB with AHSA1/START domain